jgi:hypothetical protein
VRLRVGGSGAWSGNVGRAASLHGVTAADARIDGAVDGPVADAGIDARALIGAAAGAARRHGSYSTG